MPIHKIIVQETILFELEVEAPDEGVALCLVDEGKRFPIVHKRVIRHETICKFPPASFAESVQEAKEELVRRDRIVEAYDVVTTPQEEIGPS
jgi:hypothetical protein